MSGYRRIGGEFHNMDTRWDWRDQANRFSLVGCAHQIGPRRGYQIRADLGAIALWWVDYRTSSGEENRKLAEERLIGLYATEREAEIAARMRMNLGI